MELKIYLVCCCQSIYTHEKKLKSHFMTIINLIFNNFYILTKRYDRYDDGERAIKYCSAICHHLLLNDNWNLYGY